MANLTANLKAPKPTAMQDHKTVTLGEALDIFDAALANAAAIPTTGGTTTLSAGQAVNALFSVTGTLTSNAVVELPSGSDKGRARQGVVYNGTAGNFTVTFRYQGGTGFVVPRGFAVRFWHDGTNCYPIGLPHDLSGRVPSARVHATVPQSSPDSTFTALNFDGERWDTAAIHDPVTNNVRLTCTAAGEYAIGASVHFAANAAGYRFLILRLNGVTGIGGNGASNFGASQTVYLEVQTRYRLAVGDYVEVVVYQTSGAGLSTSVVGNISPEFYMGLVGW